MGRLRAGIARVLAYALPAYVVMALTIMVHGAVAPWAAAQPLLDRHAGQTALQVGIGSGLRKSPTRGLEAVKSRYYVLLPAVLDEPALLRITQVDGAAPVETRTRAGFFLLLAALLGALVGSWWIWVRPVLHAAGPRSRDDA